MFRLIVDQPASPSANMAIDEMLMLGQGRADSIPTLRFYTWSESCMSIGYFQSVKDFPKQSVIRRITGGGSVQHGKDLTFSITATFPNDIIPSAVKDSYLKVNEAVRVGLKPLFPALDYADCRDVLSMRERQRDRVCFEKPDCHDLLLGGRKILGASQRRIGNKFLHQSALYLDGSKETLISAIKEGFEKVWKIKFKASALTPSEKDQALDIEKTRYADPLWFNSGLLLRAGL